MKLLAYVLDGQVLGVDKLSWNSNEFNGTPFSACTDSAITPSGYTDISSLNTWIKYGETTTLNYVQIRNEIIKFLPVDVSSLDEEIFNGLKKYNLYQYYKIYDRVGDGNVIESDHPPIDVNYDIMGYAKKRTFNQGELTRVEYYDKFNPTANTYSDLVVVENRTYYRINQLLNSRIINIAWILDDGVTTGYTKTTYKNYTPLEAIQAGQSRRQNVIADLEINVIGLLMQLGTGGTGTTTLNSLQAQMSGAPFLSTYNAQISKFIQGFEEDIKDAIAADTQYPWLNLVIPNTGGITIRQYLIAGLTIDYTENNTNI
jgi:hypothetical protein